MTLRKTPEISAARLPETFAFVADDSALKEWNPAICAAAQEADNTISILDAIGFDPWTGTGVTSKRVAAALRSIGERDVFVDINSPGGDFFEGVAIYNLLRAHKGKVNVRILGMAASAASVIAMAGDRVEIGKAGFLMVHNAWVVAVGNRHDMLAAADTLEPFDAAMAAVYAEKSGVERKVAARWMDDETWFNGEDAVAAKLADDFLPADAAKEDAAKAALSPEIRATKRADAAFARSGMSRDERRSLIGAMKAGPAVAGQHRPAVAGDDWAAAAMQLIDTIKG